MPIPAVSDVQNLSGTSAFLAGGGSSVLTVLTTGITLALGTDYAATQAATHTLPTAVSGDIGKLIFITSYADNVIIARGANLITEAGSGNDIGLSNNQSMTLAVRAAGVYEIVRFNVVTSQLGVSQGIPAGGTANQVLSKASATDYDATWRNAEVTIPLASAVSSSAVARAAVSGWTIPVVSGRKYRVQILATYQTAATTTGGSLGIAATSGAAGTVAGQMRGTISAAAAATELSIPVYSAVADATGSFLTTTGVSAINTPHFIGGDFVFVATASGNLELRWGSEVAASAAQLNAGSALIYRESF